MKMRNRKGFTLIELMIVIAIILILGSLAIPMITGKKRPTPKSSITITSGKAIDYTLEKRLTDIEAELADLKGYHGG